MLRSLTYIFLVIIKPIDQLGSVCRGGLVVAIEIVSHAQSKRAAQATKYVMYIYTTIHSPKVITLHKQRNPLDI